MPTQAGPLAGDHDAARIVVGPGATLVVEPVAATVALPGPDRTTSELAVTVQAGGRLVLEDAPLVLAAGADVLRRVTVELEHGAAAALREIVVLGRDGEGSGALDSALRVTLDSSALLHDALRLTPASERYHAHVALPPSHRVACTAYLLGLMRRELSDQPKADSSGLGFAQTSLGTVVLDLHGPGALARATGVALAGSERGIAGAWAAWSRAVLSQPPWFPL